MMGGFTEDSIVELRRNYYYFFFFLIMDFTTLILCLHYVPGGPGSPVCSKRSVPWNFGQIFLCFQDLLRLVKFSYLALQYP